MALFPEALMNQIALDGSMPMVGFVAKGFVYRAGGPSQCLNVAKFTTKSGEAPASKNVALPELRNLGAVVASCRIHRGPSLRDSELPVRLSG